LSLPNSRVAGTLHHLHFGARGASIFSRNSLTIPRDSENVILRFGESRRGIGVLGPLTKSTHRPTQSIGNMAPQRAGEGAPP